MVEEGNGETDVSLPQSTISHRFPIPHTGSSGYRYLDSAHGIVSPGARQMFTRRRFVCIRRPVPGYQLCYLFSQQYTNVVHLSWQHEARCGQLKTKQKKLIYTKQNQSSRMI